VLNITRYELALNKILIVYDKLILALWLIDFMKLKDDLSIN